MKTLQLSTIVLLLASVFISCNKEDIETSPAPAKTKGPKPQAIATVAMTVNPNPATISSTIVVDGTVTFDVPVDQFNYVVEYSTTPDGFEPDGVTPKWTGWQTAEEKVVKLNADDAKDADKVVATTFPFSFKVDAEEIGIGTSAWRLRLTGQDVKSDIYKEEILVINPDTECPGLDLTVVEPIKATSADGINYDFEVTYRVTSCPELGWAKLQGGLTAVTGFDESGLSSSDKAETTKGKERKLTNNNNHIIQWDFIIGQDYDHTFTVKFTKELKGEGPHQITGGWSVSAKDPVTGDDIKVEVDPVVFEK